MRLVKRKSKKHPGCVFLKVQGTDDFVVKIYARKVPSETENLAYAIIDAAKNVVVQE